MCLNSPGKQYLHISFMYVVDVVLSLNTPLKFMNFSHIFSNDCNTSSGIYFGINAFDISNTVFWQNLYVFSNGIWPPSANPFSIEMW
jgi:hypothetical protein